MRKKAREKYKRSQKKILTIKKQKRRKNAEKWKIIFSF